MKLIFIHGRAQEDYEETYLKQLWTDSLKEGLKSANLELPSQIKIEFPYYGKLLKKLVDEARSKPPSTVVTRSQNVINETAEYEFLRSYLSEIVSQSDLPIQEQAELQDKLAKKRGILNWAPIQAVLALLDNVSAFGDLTLKQFTEDVFLYLNISTIKSQVNEVIEKYFDEEPCVVVGHSLGSVVSYLILKQNPQYPVQKLITVGSPLGVKAVKKYLGASLIMPKCIKDGWFNAFDPRDVVALHPLDEKHFNINPSIENKKDVKNQTKGRHSIDGYLNDPIVAKTIYDALTSKG